MIKRRGGRRVAGNMSGARNDLASRNRVWLVRSMPAVGLCAALLLGAALLSAIGKSPASAYRVLVSGAFGDIWGFGDSLARMTPLLIAGLGVAVALKAGFFNIGAEGQLYLGGMAAAIVGLRVGGLPFLLHVPAAFLAAFAAGALWATVAAMLKVYRGVNEVISTLLMNYVAINIVGYAVRGPLMEPGAPYPYSPPLPPTATLPAIIPFTDAHGGVLVGLALAAVLKFALSRTSLGYEIRAVGVNPTAARYNGISLSQAILKVAVMSGGLAGLAGAVEVMGLQHRLFDRFSPGYGYDAIIVAFLAGGEPLGIPISALFFGALRAGASAMQRVEGIPAAMVQTIQGITVLFIAAGLAMSRWPAIRRWLDAASVIRQAPAGASISGTQDERARKCPGHVGPGDDGPARDGPTRDGPTRDDPGRDNEPRS